MQKKILIIGASGLVGTACALEFSSAGSRSLNSFSTDSRLASSRYLPAFSIDLQDRTSCAEFIERQCQDVTHLVYIAVFELPGLIQGWTDERQISTNGLMLENIFKTLV